MPDAAQPLFSIVITTCNRREIVLRCVESCRRQTEPEVQIVVVDDGSGDDTVSVLTERYGDEIELVTHARNRGINPARRSGVEQARREWIVVIDSDWVLHPDALARFRKVIEGLPPNVLAIRSRIEADGGRSSLILCRRSGRLRGAQPLADAKGGSDSIPCMHRGPYTLVPYVDDRRGGVEELYELDLAQPVQSVYIADVLGHQFFDAGNSYLRSVRPSLVIPQVLGDAADLLWMAETVLERHGRRCRPTARGNSA